MSSRHAFADLVRFGTSLLETAGLDHEKAETTAQLLVTADAMGHTTHGLAQLADYLNEIASGAMKKSGEPSVISDRGATATWDGERLPGVWLAAKALALACERAAQHGVCAIAIRRSHHIGCLAAFLPAATERGLFAILTCSDPSAAMVAPFGGKSAVFTPDPIAVGIPTDGDPILIDMSASITTAGMSARLRKEGRKFPGPWAIDAAGSATDDPRALTDGGALLPTGGLDHGQKGYGLALLVEALTQGLSAYGRADAPAEWGASVFVQVMDPNAFGGLNAFLRTTSFIADACRAAVPIDENNPVRLPGAHAIAGLIAARAKGLSLHPGILDSLQPFANKLGVAMPRETP
jgi:L-lactate dehydrogenase